MSPRRIFSLPDDDRSVARASEAHVGRQECIEILKTPKRMSDGE